MHKPKRSPVSYRLSRSLNSYHEVFSSEEEDDINNLNYSEITGRFDNKHNSKALSLKRNRINKARITKSASGIKERKKWKDNSKSGISNIKSQILNHLAVGNTGTPTIPKIKRTIKSEAAFSPSNKLGSPLTRTIKTPITRNFETPITRTIRTLVKRPIELPVDEQSSTSESSSSEDSDQSPTVLRRALLKNVKSTMHNKRSKTFDIKMEIHQTVTPPRTDLKSIKRTAILSKDSKSTLTPFMKTIDLTDTSPKNTRSSNFKPRIIIPHNHSSDNKSPPVNNSRQFVSRKKNISPISAPDKNPKPTAKKEAVVVNVLSSDEEEKIEIKAKPKDEKIEAVSKKSPDKSSVSISNMKRKDSTSSSSSGSDSDSGSSSEGSDSGERKSASDQSSSDGEIKSSSSEDWTTPVKKGKMLSSVVSATKPKVSRRYSHHSEEDWDCCNDFDDKTPKKTSRKSYSGSSSRHDDRDILRRHNSQKTSLRRKSDYSTSRRTENRSSDSNRRLSERLTSSVGNSRKRSFNNFSSGALPIVYDSRENNNMSLFSNELKFNLHKEWDKNRVNNLRSVLCDEMTSKVKFVDTHCHIDFLFKRLSYRNSFSRYMDEAFFKFPSNYEGCIADWCQPSLYSTARSILNNNDRKHKIWGAFGCHPHFVNTYDDLVEKEIEHNISHYENVIAWGEMGLDYSDRFGKTDHDLQISVFKRQLKKACSMSLPLVIHCRDADEDLIKVMKRYVPHDTKIHRHCFTTEEIDVRPMLEYFPNCYVGFTNLLTNKSAYRPRSAVQDIPLKRILLETDCPYFIPRCVSGGSKSAAKYSHPGMASSVACEIADLKGTTTDEVLTQIRKNVTRMYGI